MNSRNILSIVIIIAIVLVIGYLESSKPKQLDAPVEELATKQVKDTTKYPAAKEIVNPSGFLNTDEFKLADLIGEQVILIDFWTYSCINCQRTLPYLNAWHEQYGGQGLTIVGMHTPEFEFEKERDNVQAAIDKFDIKYPVVQDNDFSTWRAYNNRYWPRKYLIDINGQIVYDHIGEGGYEETEDKIRGLLAERSKQLGLTDAMPQDKVNVEASAPSAGVGSPEVYFGSSRNELLSNGTPGKAGLQSFEKPRTAKSNQLLFTGDWDITPEYAQNTTEGTITFKYKAKNVFMVAASEKPIVMQVWQDGQLLQEITVNNEELYTLIEGDLVSEHLLELRLKEPGLKAFTFTFG